MEKEIKLELYTGSWASLIPFLIFIVITIGLSFINAADLNMMTASGVLGLVIGMLFARDKIRYWDVVLEGLGQKLAMTAVLIWLIVGIYGAILKSGHIVEGLVWLGLQLQVKGAAFTVIAFLFSATFAVATGAAFGTVAAMGFILYPAGILLGSDPAVLGGAILSGAIFGDNIAPVSDTTIVSSFGQTYKYKEGSAEIGGCVRNRVKYLVIPFIISVCLFYLFGAAGSGQGLDPAKAGALLAEYQNPAGLLMLLPTAVVIWLAVRGVNLFIALSIGILLAIAVGLGAGLFGLSALFSLSESGQISGALPDGVGGMTTVCILLMVIVSMGRILIASGFMTELVDYLSRKTTTVRGAELVMYLFATVFSVLISAINTIPNICASPLLNAVGRKNGLHPYRRANLLAVTVCSFNVCMPFGGSILLLLGIMKTLSSTYSFVEVMSPSAFLLTPFYPILLWFTTLAAVITGWGRIYEGKGGSVADSPYDGPIVQKD